MTKQSDQGGTSAAARHAHSGDWSVAPIDRVAAPLREQVIAMTRTAILEFQLRPGQRLIERELIERFGVSRTTIREALRDLAAEGLVTVVPQKGAMVSIPSRDEAADLYDIRAHLESLAVERFATRATADQISRLGCAVDELVGASYEVEPSTQAILHAKDDFYEVLIEGAGSEALKQLLVSLQARVRVLRATSLSAPGRAREAAEEIKEVFDAIERRDGSTAAQLCAAHVKTAASTALQELEVEVNERFAPGQVSAS